MRGFPSHFCVLLVFLHSKILFKVFFSFLARDAERIFAKRTLLLGSDDVGESFPEMIYAKGLKVENKLILLECEWRQKFAEKMDTSGESSYKSSRGK